MNVGFVVRAGEQSYILRFFPPISRPLFNCSARAYDIRANLMPTFEPVARKDTVPTSVPKWRWDKGSLAGLPSHPTQEVEVFTLKRRRHSTVQTGQRAADRMMRRRRGPA